MSDLLQPIVADSYVGKIPAGANTTLHEKLLKLFNPTDFVRVINIDTQPYIWQYMPASKENITFDMDSSTVPMKNTYREPPEVYELQPGQSAIIVGASAYLMIEGLIKRMISEETIARQSNMQPGQARKFAYGDDIKQQELIKEIYLGKEMPGATAPLGEPTEPETSEESGTDGKPTYKSINRRKATV